MKTKFLIGVLIFTVMASMAGLALRLNKDDSFMPSNQRFLEESASVVNGEQASTSSAGGENSRIIINHTVLAGEQIQEFTRQYGRISAGNYWYDARSGLYGHMGGPALDMIAAGHDFGILPRDASGGTTDILVNGREITQSELALLQQYLGTVAPGLYWLDANGNYGVEGYNVALGNLYADARTSGGGSAGDNFWSQGNFGAGNYNADNTQGYVSVPGYGPVDYGF